MNEMYNHRNSLHPNALQKQTESNKHLRDEN